MIETARHYTRQSFHALGNWFLGFATMLGSVTQLILQTARWILRGAVDARTTVQQMVEIGINSSPVIALSSFFTGMVLALQTGASSRNIFNEPIYIGTVVGFSLVKELGPVLTAIVMAGRVGASIAAEIGTMKVTEQVDALFTLGTSPVRYLAVPRYIACGIMIPLLTVMANIIGIMGGLLVTVYRWDIPSSVYWEDILSYMWVSDFMHGFIKSVFFSIIIATTSIYQGLQCEGGAEGVGKSTTSAVMIAMILILISDYFLSALLVALRIG